MTKPFFLLLLSLCFSVPHTDAFSLQPPFFIIGTELGICHTLEKENPGKTIVHVSPLADCPNMKLTTLEKILWSLEGMQYEVTVPEKIAGRARQAIERMLALA